MEKNRLEAFSDGVIAIIITIMVLELKAPHGTELADLKELLPVFLSYLLSFVYVGIYWNNHHHLFQSTKKVTGSILWANLHLLFWLSLFPFTTAWIGENHLAATPGSDLWGSAGAGGNGVLCPATRNYFRAGRQFPAGGGIGQRLERKTLARTLFGRHSAGIFKSMDRDQPVCVCRADVVYSRSPY